MRAPSALRSLSCALVAVLASTALALDLDVPLDTPRLDGLTVSVPVAGQTAAVSLQLAYDERGKVVQEGPCTVDGSPVTVSGTVKEVGGVPTYKLVLRNKIEKLRVKLQGTLSGAGAGTLASNYKGPKGKEKGSAAVTLDRESDLMSLAQLDFVTDGQGRVVGKGGKVSGTATVISGFGNSPEGLGTVKGKLKNGVLKLVVKHGKSKLTFKGLANGDDFVGQLKVKLLPEKKKRAGYTVTGFEDDSGGGGGGGPKNAVAQSLEKLGVKTDETPRKDYSKIEDLPEDYAPFGSQKNLSKIDEILLVGIGRDDQPSRLELVEQDVDGNTQVLKALDSSENFWADTEIKADGSRTDQTLRHVTAADVDGDGLEEIVAVYMDDLDLTLKLIDDATTDYAESLHRLGVQQGVKDLTVVGGDFDADGAQELAVALCRDDSAQVLFFEDKAGDFRLQGTQTKTIPSSVENASLYTQLRVGNLDFDNGQELVLLFNELIESGQVSGTCRYFVFDDAAANHAELKSAFVQGQANGFKTAQAGSVDVGDIDGDNVDEIVFAGLTNMVSTGCGPVETLLVALDDAPNGFAALGAREQNLFIQNCPAFAPWRFRHAFVGCADIDGDGASEIHANQVVYDNFAGDSDPWTEIHRIDQIRFFRGGSDQSARFSDLNAQMFTADVTGDGRENIVVYTEWRRTIAIWGLDQIPQRGWREMGLIETEFRPLAGSQIVPVNVDRDSAILQYDAGEYRLAFTEPVVIAALAAPPCERGIGQNVDACATKFGTSATTTNAEQLEVSMSVGANVGVNVDGGVLTQSEFELKASTEVKATDIAARSYSLTKVVVFEGGANDDAVVFTTIPYDQYTYVVLSHPDPDLVGRELVISLPRAPITLKADRSFYNATIDDPDLRVGSEVFGHTVGDLSTYPDASRKNQLIQQFGGLQSDLQSVSQGDRSEEVTLIVSEELTTGRSLELGFQLEVNTTAGTVLGGFTVGSSRTNTLTVTNGESTIYTGIVGDLDAANFAANRFSFGLFTYVFRDPRSGREFEVLNYWVEQ